MRDEAPDCRWDHFSTAGFRPREGLRRWTDWGRQAFGGLRVRPSDLETFSGSAARIALGPAVLSVMKFTPAQAVNCLPDEGPQIDDAIVFSLPQAGSFTYAGDDGAPVEARQGDIYVRDLTRLWASATSGRSELITLRVPFQDFVERFGDVAPVAGRLFCGSRPEVACVGGVMRSATALLETLPSDEHRRTLAKTVLDALELLKDKTARTDKPAEMSLHRQAVSHITRNLDDPALSPSSVARALGVRPRSLQRVFQARGATVQGLILELRLARAARTLQDAAGPVEITGLAMSVGFNDMAYFSRAFARRYGKPPSRFAQVEFN